MGIRLDSLKRLKHVIHLSHKGIEWGIHTDEWVLMPQLGLERVCGVTLYEAMLMVSVCLYACMGLAATTMYNVIIAPLIHRRYSAVQQVALWSIALCLCCFQKGPWLPSKHTEIALSVSGWVLCVWERDCVCDTVCVTLCVCLIER